MEFHSVSRNNNINLIRYYLAICILTNHFCGLSGIDVVLLPRIFGGAGSFFAISGFLMFPSYEKRPDVKRYLRRRADRIFPPYFLIVFLAAVLCVFVSTLSPAEYFTSSEFWKYLAANLSFLNFLAPDLPGVFTDAANKLTAVNGSLWTMKGEVACYLTVPVIFWLCKRIKVAIPRLLEIFMAIFLILYLYFRVRIAGGHPDEEVEAKQSLVMFLFYMGGYLNHNLDIVWKYSKWLILICGTALMYRYINSNWLGIQEAPIPGLVFNHVILPLASGLMVIVCAMTGKWGHWLANHNAITYEIYLFHYPVIQTMLHFGCIDRLGFYPSLLLSIAITALMAWTSWHFIGIRFTSKR